MKRKTLIVYETRYEATTSTSEEFAKVLRDESFDVQIVNAREEKVDDISEYDLIIVGSDMKIDRIKVQKCALEDKLNKKKGKKNEGIP